MNARKVIYIKSWPLYCSLFQFTVLEQLHSNEKSD